MHPFLTALPTLTISALFCLWNVYQSTRQQRERKLRERVAYMLWVMASRVE